MSGTLPPKESEGNDTRPLWTVVDVANYLKLKPGTVRAMVRRDEIPGYKVGRVWRFRCFCQSKTRPVARRKRAHQGLIRKVSRVENAPI